MNGTILHLDWQLILYYLSGEEHKPRPTIRHTTSKTLSYTIIDNTILISIL